VQGWNPTGNDRHRFVCRAKKLATYEDDGALSGWTFGNRKSKTVNGRIYDKTREIAGNGHDWWHDIWGPKYDPECRCGGSSSSSTAPPSKRWVSTTRQSCSPPSIGSGPTPPTSGSPTVVRRTTTATARWPLSAEWEKIQRVTLAGNALPMERIRAGRAAGGLRTSMPGINGYVATFAAWTGHDTIDDACAALPNYLRNYEATSGRTFIDRVTDKRRRNQ
jgi:hypothetical protein